APRGREGELQVGAWQLQVRRQPHPDPELLPAGRGEGGRRVPPQDRRHHRRERPGPLPRQVHDEVSCALSSLSPPHSEERRVATRLEPWGGRCGATCILGPSFETLTFAARRRAPQDEGGVRAGSGTL